MAFVRAAWWDVRLEATAEPPSPGGEVLGSFDAVLVALDGDGSPRAATSAATGGSRTTSSCSSTRQTARGLAGRLDGAAFTVKSVERKPYLRRPSAPFATSTLQQEAGRKLRFTSQRTMQVAQRLYENGYITYMRTDSTTLSDAALTAAQAGGELYGPVRARAIAALRPQGQERRRRTRRSGLPATRSDAPAGRA